MLAKSASARSRSTHIDPLGMHFRLIQRLCRQSDAALSIGTVFAFYFYIRETFKIRAKIHS